MVSWNIDLTPQKSHHVSGKCVTRPLRANEKRTERPDHKWCVLSEWEPSGLTGHSTHCVDKNCTVIWTEKCVRELNLPTTYSSTDVRASKNLHCRLRLERLRKSDTCLASFLSLARFHYSLLWLSWELFLNQSLLCKTSSEGWPCGPKTENRCMVGMIGFSKYRMFVSLWTSKFIVKKEKGKW